MKNPEDMTPQEIKDEIKFLEDQRRVLCDRLNDLCRNQAARECPYKVGDVLVDGRGQRAVVQEIRASFSRYGPSYSMGGRYLKKDGSPSKRYCHFFTFENWRKPDNVDKGNT